MDTLIHGIAADATIRWMAAITTDIVREATRRHGAAPMAADALGRTLTGTILLGASLKEFDRLSVRIEADGAIGGITTETLANGSVRGYVKNPLAEGGSVSEIIGNGMLSITREMGFEIGLQDPYRGSVPIISGEIAEDFANYLMKSEQIPSAVMLGVALQKEEPFISCAGGVMLQVLPGANEHIITMLEDSISHAPALTKLIRSGATAVELIETILGVIDYQILEEKPIQFACNCSMERAISLISMIEKEELEDMLEKDKGASMNCHFCNETYVLGEEKLREIIDRDRSLSA